MCLPTTSTSSSSPSLQQSRMGVVESVGKSPEGETFKYSVFADSRVVRTGSKVVDDTLQGDLDRFWDMDSVGIRDNDTVLEAFENNLSFEDGMCLRRSNIGCCQIILRTV